MALRPNFFEAVEHLVGLFCEDRRGREAVKVIESVQQALRVSPTTVTLVSSEQSVESGSEYSLSPEAAFSERSDWWENQLRSLHSVFRHYPRRPREGSNFHHQQLASVPGQNLPRWNVLKYGHSERTMGDIWGPGHSSALLSFAVAAAQSFHCQQCRYSVS